MKKLILINLILALILAGCTKLEEELFGKIPGDKFPENEQQIANLSVEAYSRLRELGDNHGWWFLAQELSADGLAAPTRGADWDDGGKWTNLHRHLWSNDDEPVNKMWSTYQGGVTMCNQILDMLRALPKGDAIEAKIKEVEVLRAFYYYLLIDNYGDVPYLTTTKGVPEKPFRISRAAIFDSLVTSVSAAIPHLPANDIKYMVTRYTAYALLAKLYMNAEVYSGTAQWEKAGLYCDSVLAGPYFLETGVTDAFVTNNSASPEIIFSIPFDENMDANDKGFRLHMRTLHYQHNLKYNMPVGPWNGFAVVPEFFDTYELTDKRRTGYFIFGPQLASNGNQILDGETKKPLDIIPHLPALVMQPPQFTPEVIRMSGARVGKFEIKMGAKEYLSNDFPLFRLTDFYLMKAEAEIRQGRSGDQWINPIRSRAGVATWSGATLTQLLAERGRELFCEGHRRQDLIRFGVWGNAWWEKATSLPERETFPIPKWATDANPNLLQ